MEAQRKSGRIADHAIEIGGRIVKLIRIPVHQVVFTGLGKRKVLTIQALVNVMI